MDQESALQQGSASAETLTDLVVRQLGATMGVLTMHDVGRASPRIITRRAMSEDLANTVALLVNQDVAQRSRSNGAGPNGANDTKAPLRDGLGLSRISFPCHVAPTQAIVLTACQADGPLTQWSMGEYLQLSSWIEPSLTLLWHLEREHARRNGLMQAIDRCDFGFLLLDADGIPLLMNTQARRLLDASDGIRRAGQAIAALNFDDTIRLQSAIHYESVSSNDLQVLLLRRSKLPPLTAVVASLAGTDSAAVALYIIDPERDCGAMARAWCSAYGLTATEALLAQHLVTGATVEEAARSMHVQKHTARTYLRQVFAKTGTHRQAQLVSKILGGIVRVS